MQTPLPPLAPPEPSIFNQHTLDQMLLALTVVAITTAVLFLVRPLFKALARRVEAGTASPALLGEVEQLRQQLGELEPLRDRVHELEERLEFTERLLTRQKDQEILPRQGPPQ